jgi:Na+/melibiose symporter-like transporter
MKLVTAFLLIITAAVLLATYATRPQKTGPRVMGRLGVVLWVLAVIVLLLCVISVWRRRPLF